VFQKVRASLIFLTVLNSFCTILFGQQKTPTVVQEATTANCSNVQVSGGISTFTCSGLTTEQTKLLIDIPSLINKLLKQEKQDAATLLSRLDICIDQTAGRVITKEHQRELEALLRLDTPNQYTLIIQATNATPESKHYAEQIKDIFLAAHWNVPPVFYNLLLGNGPSAPEGLTVYLHDGTSAPSLIIQKSFDFSHIVEAKYFVDASLLPSQVLMVVGTKPIN